MEARTPHSPHTLTVRDHALGGVWFPVLITSSAAGASLTVRVYGTWAQQRANLPPVRRASRGMARRAAVALARLLRGASSPREHNRIARQWHAAQMARSSHANLDRAD